MTDAPELLPRPFCGSTDTASVPVDDFPDYDADYGVVIQCMTCGARGPDLGGTTGFDAAQAWNTRAPDPRIAAAEAAMAKQAADLVAEDYVADAILALVPSDGQSALDQVIAEAREEGMRKAHEAVSELPEDAQKVWALEAITVAMMRASDAAIRERGE